MKNLALVLLGAFLTPYLYAAPADSASDETPQAGEWAATATGSEAFKNFQFKVDAERTGITEISFSYSGLECGPVDGVTKTQSVEQSTILLSSKDAQGEVQAFLPITAEGFTTGDPSWGGINFAFSGKFVESGTRADGTWQSAWNDVMCAGGTWEAHPKGKDSPTEDLQGAARDPEPTRSEEQDVAAASPIKPGDEPIRENEEARVGIDLSEVAPRDGLHAQCVKVPLSPGESFAKRQVPVWQFYEGSAPKLKELAQLWNLSEFPLDHVDGRPLLDCLEPSEKPRRFEGGGWVLLPPGYHALGINYTTYQVSFEEGHRYSWGVSQRPDITTFSREAVPKGVVPAKIVNAKTGAVYYRYQQITHYLLFRFKGDKALLECKVGGECRRPSPSEKWNIQPRKLPDLRFHMGQLQ